MNISDLLGDDEVISVDLLTKKYKENMKKTQDLAKDLGLSLDVNRYNYCSLEDLKCGRVVRVLSREGQLKPPGAVVKITDERISVNHFRFFASYTIEKIEHLFVKKTNDDILLEILTQRLKDPVQVILESDSETEALE